MNTRSGSTLNNCRSTKDRHMIRLLYTALLGIFAGLAACGHRTIERGPDGEITSVMYSDGAPSGTCYVMTLSPGLQSLRGDYSPPEKVCYVFAIARPETEPLFHLENGSSGDHLYTARSTEISEAAGWGYAFKDTCCYVYPAAAPGRTPLYRLSKPGTWCHFYTTSEAERDDLVQFHGFTAEGVVCYVPQDLVDGARVLSRLRKVSDGR